MADRSLIMLGNWVFEVSPELLNYRVTDGKPALATSYGADFCYELDAYVAGPDAWKEHRRKALGDMYEPLESCRCSSPAEYRAKQEAECAAKEKEAKALKKDTGLGGAFNNRRNSNVGTMWPSGDGCLRR